MKFLVVLICITANYFWKHDLDRFDDSWFFNLRNWLENRSAGLVDRYDNGWLATMVLVFLVPLIFLGIVLWLVDGLVFDLLTIGIHIMVLLFAIDRTHPGMLAQNYLDRWREGDFEACFLYLNEHLSGQDLHSTTDPRTLHLNFERLYTYRCFERMFVMIFWYVVAGPISVVFVYICYQYRDGKNENANQTSEQVNNLLLLILEWLPLRLLGLTFCLVGDFESCFGKYRTMFFSNQRPTDEAVHELATAALGLNTGQSILGAVQAGGAEKPEAFRDLAALEIDALQALLERSQIIWLCFLAVAAVFGLGV
ncbi:MAG: regulatory signaling modulator protein AmpE [Pseudohongiellaceae bacterium]